MIKIIRNEQGNCINFEGSSNPTYWNACLSGEVDSEDANAVNVINDVITSETGVTEYEFYKIPFTEFSDKDGNAFANATEAAEYITAQANVIGLGGGGTDLNGVDLCFSLDDTSTSILLDNGYHYGVNAIQAIAHADGTIHIVSVSGGDITHFYGLEVGKACIGTGVIAGGLNDVVNTLNELFTVGAFESVVIADPHSTLVADVGGVDTTGGLVGDAINPSGDDIGAGVSAHYNKAGYKSTETIDQAGEYFTFNMRNEGIFGACLVLDDIADAQGNLTYADPTKFCDGVTNTGNMGIQWGMFFHPSPNGPWTYYGALTGTVYGSGWNGVDAFRYSNDGANWLAGNAEEFRIGIDANSYISMEYYNNDTSLWVVVSRTNYPVGNNVKFHLGIKFCDSVVRLVDNPKVHLLEAAAPTMNFRYIESPDGNYEYPLFATEEEANFYDLNSGGTGASHTHTYADDPTSTTWYMSDNGATMTETGVPSGAYLTFLSNAVTFTEITSLTDADLTPSAFSFSDISQEEGTAVNLQLYPAGATFSQSATISPNTSGLVYNTSSHYLQGTLADVGSDTVYTITVIRANSYGSTTSTFTITATDVPVASTLTTPWNKAVVLNGANEYLYQVSNSNSFNPINMGGMNNDVWGANNGKTSTDTDARPWSISQVVYIDNSKPQCYFSQGENSANDRISLSTHETGANSKIEFYWGRSTGTGGANSNGVQFLFDKPSDGWYGYYIDTTGFRPNQTQSTTAALATNFRFKQVDLSTGTVTDITGTWAIVGDGRLNRGLNGAFYIGRESDSSFNSNHSLKVAATLISTLKRDFLLPDDTEISMQVRDPQQWVIDYRDGTQQRLAYNNTPYSFDTYPERCVQLWLMGDGASDSYSNNLRNDVKTADQNYTMLRLQNMVSNDIETVNINGLT
tara:strand:+ start:666 stop:3404 length:2739 start_codon:yes stop_codon:yes gene_type:complete